MTKLSPDHSSWSYSEAFSRHAGILTEQDQAKLRQSRVAIVGMGGVGGHHLLTLTRLGIGAFTVADLDTFEAANFNRQAGARCSTIGLSKVDVMSSDALDINPELDIRRFPDGLNDENIDEFLADASLFVDGIDFFSLDLRAKLFDAAAARGIFAVTAAPLGFSTAWLVFDPNGMSFAEYFDLANDKSDAAHLLNFAFGLAPNQLHTPYFDWSRVDLAKQRGPSTNVGCILAAAVTATECKKIILGESVNSVPEYSQFDAQTGEFARGRLAKGVQEEKAQTWVEGVQQMLGGKD